MEETHPSPRIARNSTIRRLDPPRLLPTHTPALGSHASRTPTPFHENFSLSTTHQLVDTITSAALAAINQYLANMGLLPQTTQNPQPLAPSLARTTSDPPILVQTSAPAPVPHSMHHIDNDTRYLQDDSLPHPSSTPSPPGFDRVFTTKM